MILKDTEPKMNPRYKSDRQSETRMRVSLGAKVRGHAGNYMYHDDRDKKQTLNAFMTRVEKADTGCWNWIGIITLSGYGKFSVGKTLWNAHRWSWQHFTGNTIPFNHQIDHLCRNRRCVNPEHLEAVTAGENIRRIPKVDACKKGHTFTPESTVMRNGTRRCLLCRSLKQIMQTKKNRGPRPIAKFKVWDTVHCVGCNKDAMIENRRWRINEWMYLLPGDLPHEGHRESELTLKYERLTADVRGLRPS